MVLRHKILRYISLKTIKPMLKDKMIVFRANVYFKGGDGRCRIKPKWNMILNTVVPGFEIHRNRPFYVANQILIKA